MDPERTSPQRLRLLGADGAPAASETALTTESPAPGADKPSPMPLNPVVLTFKDGPLTVRVKAEFDDSIKVGGDRGKFEKGIEAMLGHTTSFGVRLVELMLLGAMNNEGATVSKILSDAISELRAMRGVVETISARLQAGESAVPSLVVASDVPPDPVKAP